MGRKKQRKRKGEKIMDSLQISFSDVIERDIDLLLCEEIISSKKFAQLFLSKTDIKDADPIKAELSKTDVEYGESDITVIFLTDKRHALLIEDKIAAEAMPNQCERYFKRGRLGVKNGEYDSFDVFIVAPEKYLQRNEEAKKYPNKISYEECITYFQNKNNPRALFKARQLSDAIKKQALKYNVCECKPVTDFWHAYISFVEQNAPELVITGNNEVKGKKARWVCFKTNIKGSLIYHKSESGYMDLTIPNASDKIPFLLMFLEKYKEADEKNEIACVKTGKSAAFRIKVPAIDFMEQFGEAYDKIQVCIQACKKLYLLSQLLSRDVLFVKTLFEE